MLDNVFETVVIGSNTQFLDIPQKDFFSNYEKLDIKTAQNFTEKYFNMKGKEGIPCVKDIKVDDTVENVKIVVDIN